MPPTMTPLDLLQTACSIGCDQQCQWAIAWQNDIGCTAKAGPALTPSWSPSLLQKARMWASLVCPEWIWSSVEHYIVNFHINIYWTCFYHHSINHHIHSNIINCELGDGTLIHYHYDESEVKACKSNKNLTFTSYNKKYKHLRHLSPKRHTQSSAMTLIWSICSIQINLNIKQQKHSALEYAKVKFVQNTVPIYIHSQKLYIYIYMNSNSPGMLPEVIYAQDSYKFLQPVRHADAKAPPFYPFLIILHWRLWGGITCPSLPL